MITLEEYKQLYEKYISGSCSPEEMQKLQDYHKQFKIQSDSTPEANDQVIADRIYKKIETSMRRPSKRFFYSWAAAAIFCVSLSVAIVFLNKETPKPLTIAKSNNTIIRPGSTQATLTLSNGEVVELNKVTKDWQAKQEGASIIQINQGELIYDSNQSGRTEKAMVFNTITVPRGGQYSVILSDGTRISLNSESKLRFPASFSTKERPVELLAGEAYFEVTKKKDHPFRVKTMDTEIEVLGTSFNINTYSSHSRTFTTLIEGSVKISQNKETLLLVPGQTGMSSATGLELVQYDPDYFVAWKKGYFAFEENSIKEIMETVARWYNFDVQFVGEIPVKKFGGTFSRSKSIKELLTYLSSLTGSTKFKIEGRRIMVIN